jgi:hypothetical protein
MIDRAEARTLLTMHKLCASNVSGSLRGRVVSLVNAYPGATGRVEQIWSRPSLLVAFSSLVLHVLANGHYGIFRDELYFIVCGDRPDWGYVDQPAVVPLLASWSHAIFGDFLWGFRLLPAPCAHVSDDLLCPRRSLSKALTLSFQYSTYFS